MAKDKTRKKKKKIESSIRISKSAFTTSIVILCIISVVYYDYNQRSQKAFLNQTHPARVKGSKTARLRITEFIDFQCQECARGYNVIKNFIRKYPDDITLQLKYCPLGKQNAILAATYAECAAQEGKFWEYQDLLLQYQKEWRLKPDPKKYLNHFASQVGLDVTQLNTCIESNEIASVVLAEKAYCESIFVRQTPTYFLNDERTVGVKSLTQELKRFFDGY